MVQSMYSSELAANSQTYSPISCGMPHYYEAIQVNIVESGCYQFSSNSTIDTYGFIYENNFDPFNPTMNELAEDDDGNNNNQFKLIISMQVNTTYVLIVTTHDPNVTGVYSVLVTGPNNVSLNLIGEYLYFVCE